MMVYGNYRNQLSAIIACTVVSFNRQYIKKKRQAIRPSAFSFDDFSDSSFYGDYRNQLSVTTVRYNNLSYRQPQKR